MYVDINFFIFFYMTHFRTGRNRHGFEKSGEIEQRQYLLEAARAWMELAPATAGTEPTTVEVGQPTRLLIQCTLPGNSIFYLILLYLLYLWHLSRWANG